MIPQGINYHAVVVFVMNSTTFFKVSFSVLCTVCPFQGHSNISNQMSCMDDPQREIRITGAKSSRRTSCIQVYAKRGLCQKGIMPKRDYDMPKGDYAKQGMPNRKMPNRGCQKGIMPNLSMPNYCPAEKSVVQPKSLVLHISYVPHFKALNVSFNLKYQTLQKM